jgi:Holliday junction DNA helicase RuvB
MKFCDIIYKLITTQSNPLFDKIIGYDHIKRLFRMALDSDSAIHILLTGPPASAKTMFLISLMEQLKNSYFADGVSCTKAGMIDYMFENKPRYLLVDEIDKIYSKDQAFLLNLMETGILSETKYGKTRSAEMKISVFATSNNIKKIAVPLQSRFFILDIEPYSYEQFCYIAEKLLLRQNVDTDIARIIVDATWNKSQDIRDCVRIGALAKSIEDVKFIVNNFL